MKTPDEIKKGLECCAKGNSCRGHCPYDGRSAGIKECTSQLARDALTLIPRWISVEERLPEDGKNVLIFVSTMSSWWHMEVDWRTGNSWHNNAETSWNKITHWMPLPEPPEVEHETVHDCNS